MNREKVCIKSRKVFLMKRIYKSDKGIKQNPKQVINAASSSFDFFIADDITSLLSVIEELKDKNIQAIDAGDGLWEFMIDDNVYQVYTCGI